MGAIAVGRKVYDTIVNAAPERTIELFHGYTYSGHPAACVAGIATMDIYKNENLFERGRRLSDYFLDRIFSLQDCGSVTDIRGYGMLAGIDLAPSGPAGDAGITTQKKLFWEGLHVKSTGDVLIVAPPLISTKEHVDEIHYKLKKVLTIV